MNMRFDSYNLISQNELDAFCDYSSDRIFDSLEKISLLTNLYLKCQIRVLPPFATNFRDALFHYKKLYEADTIEDAIAQAEAIDEHLSRALKDSLLQLVQVLLCATNHLYEDPSIDNHTKTDLQKTMHILKQSTLKLRIKSMDIVRVSNDEFGIIENVCDCIRRCLNNENIKSQWLDICSKYVKKIDVHLDI